MTDVMRYDPFDLLEGVMKSVLRPGYESALERRASLTGAIPIDVAETDNAYLLWANLPGMRKENIDVAIDGNVVTLAAEITQEKAVDQSRDQGRGQDQRQEQGRRELQEQGGRQGQENWLVRERPTGPITRRVQFAQEIADENAKAEYRDGVLSLTLPKKAAANRSRLAIH
jgi:HSP20 family protein